jgi:heme/copper-type cytochrome/quinol oxidase subunit 2
VEIDLVPILSTVILATTIVTIVLAIGSYFAYKMRDKRRARAKRQTAAEPEALKVFRRWKPGSGPAA